MSETIQALEPIEQAANPEQSFDGLFDIRGLERTAAEGVVTYQGDVRAFEFRAGIEIEFSMSSPQDFRKEVIENEKQSENNREFGISAVLNRESIQGVYEEPTEVLAEFRDHVRGFVQRLEARDEVEEQTRQLWLSQVDQFGTSELINFLLYEEFSKPQLVVPQPPEDNKLRSIDEYAEENGWIEWRFGNGTLQTGYYDNQNVSEIRLSPCAPSEALERVKIIKERMKQLGEQFGVLIRTSHQSEHINLSIYERLEDGSDVAIIGNEEAKARDTIDVSSGILQAQQEGVWLHPNLLKRYDYMFSKHSQIGFSVGPTRKTLRVLNGRLELRGGFYSTEQGVAWLIGGAVSGISQGAANIEKAGYAITHVDEIFKVSRTPDFKKEADLQIQRAFENSEVDESGAFELNLGYAIIRADEITNALVDLDNIKGSATQGSDVFCETIIAAARIGSEGSPIVSEDSLEAAFDAVGQKYPVTADKIKESLLVFGFSDIPTLAAHINKRFKTVRLEPEKVVRGASNYMVEDRQEAIEKLRNSNSIRLTVGKNTPQYIEQLEQAASEFQASQGNN
jgi:hypothetical protein